MRVIILFGMFIFLGVLSASSQLCDSGELLVSGEVECIGSCKEWKRSISSIKVVSNGSEITSVRLGSDKKFRVCANTTSAIFVQPKFVEPKQYDISLEEEDDLKRRSANGQISITVKSVFDIIQGSLDIAEGKSSMKDRVSYLKRLQERDYIWKTEQKKRLVKILYEAQLRNKDFEGSNKTIQSFMDLDSLGQDFLFAMKYEMSKNYAQLGDNQKQLQVLLDIHDIPENKRKLYYKTTFDAFGELYKSKSGKPYSDLGLKEFIETEPSLQEKWEEFYFKWSEINKVNEMSELLSQIEKMRTSFRYD